MSSIGFLAHLLPQPCSLYAGNGGGGLCPQTPHQSRGLPSILGPMDQFEVWDDSGAGPPLLLEREARGDGIAHFLVRRVL